MELFKEIMIRYLEKEKAVVAFPHFEMEVADMVEKKCYQALKKIKAIIENSDLSDEECFAQIEGIICVLEDIGSNGGDRHDFG